MTSGTGSLSLRAAMQAESQPINSDFAYGGDSVLSHKAETDEGQGLQGLSAEARGLAIERALAAIDRQLIIWQYDASEARLERVKCHVDQLIALARLTTRS